MPGIFSGSRLARDLRALPGKEYQGVYRSYGPRSYLYAEMVFGNTFNVRSLMASTPQAPIHAMRTPRAIALAEIVSRTHLSADEYAGLIRRSSMGSRRRPRSTFRSTSANLVLTWRSGALPSPPYASVLDDFMRLDPGPERWDDPVFAPVLRSFRAGSAKRTLRKEW